MSAVDPVPLTDAIDRALADAHAEVEALQACLAEQFGHIDELRRQREDLLGQIPVPALTGAMVRDAATRLGRFTFSELRSELDQPAVELRKFFNPMLLDGKVQRIGNVGRAPFYEYQRPDGPNPTHHPTRRPPEREPPAGTESRATGMPVRVGAQEKLGRRGRSTPGTSHLAKQRDARFERAQEVRAERAEARRSKAQKEPKWKRRK
jgi:hypothetical protein